MTRVLVVGCGVWGEVIARAVNDVPGARVSAVFDTSHTRAESLAHAVGATWLGSLDDACNECDAAIVCVPPAWHLETVRQLLRAGVKRIRVEKPCGTSSRQASIMRGWANNEGADIVVGFQMLESKAWRLAKQWARGRAIQSAVAIRMSEREARHTVSPMLDMGSHGAAYIADLKCDVPDTRIIAAAGTQDCRCLELVDVNGRGLRLSESQGTAHVVFEGKQFQFPDNTPLQDSLTAWLVNGSGRGIRFAERVHELMEACA